MNFIRRWSLFLLSLAVVYFLGYLYQYDFGFSLKINELLTEVVHFAVFVIFGFFTCQTLCREGKIKRPHAVYVFAIIFFISIMGVFNEVRIHPEHGANARDMMLHLTAGISGMIVWRLFSLIKKDVV